MAYRDGRFVKCQNLFLWAYFDRLINDQLWRILLNVFIDPIRDWNLWNLSLFLYNFYGFFALFQFNIYLLYFQKCLCSWDPIFDKATDQCYCKRSTSQKFRFNLSLKVFINQLLHYHHLVLRHFFKRIFLKHLHQSQFWFCYRYNFSPLIAFLVT